MTSTAFGMMMSVAVYADTAYRKIEILLNIYFLCCPQSVL